MEENFLTHGSCHFVTTEDFCHRLAEAYLTAKRPTVLESGTPVAGPSGVLTVTDDGAEGGQDLS